MKAAAVVVVNSLNLARSGCVQLVAPPGVSAEPPISSLVLADQASGRHVLGTAEPGLHLEGAG